MMTQQFAMEECSTDSKPNCPMFDHSRYVIILDIDETLVTSVSIIRRQHVKHPSLESTVYDSAINPNLTIPSNDLNIDHIHDYWIKNKENNLLRSQFTSIVNKNNQLSKKYKQQILIESNHKNTINNNSTHANYDTNSKLQNEPELPIPAQQLTPHAMRIRNPSNVSQFEQQQQQQQQEQKCNKHKKTNNNNDRSRSANKHKTISSMNSKRGRRWKPKKNLKWEIKSNIDYKKYQPIKGINYDLIVPSKSQQFRYYYIYLRPFAKKFIQQLIDWKKRNLIYLCIMTQGAKHYAYKVLGYLCDINDKSSKHSLSENFECDCNYITAKLETIFDLIVTQENIVNWKNNTSSQMQDIQTRKNIKSCQQCFEQLIMSKIGNNDTTANNACIKNKDQQQQQQQLQRQETNFCKIIMLDDELSYFSCFEKWSYVYNIPSFTNAELQVYYYKDCALKQVLKHYLNPLVTGMYDISIIIENKINRCIKVDVYELASCQGLVVSKTVEIQISMLYVDYVISIGGRSIQDSIISSVCSNSTLISMYKTVLRTKTAALKQYNDWIVNTGTKIIDTPQKIYKIIGNMKLDFFEKSLLQELHLLKFRDEIIFATKHEYISTIALFARVYLKMSTMKHVGPKLSNCIMT